MSSSRVGDSKKSSFGPKAPRNRNFFVEAELPKPRPTTIKEVLQMELDEKKKRKRRRPAGNKKTEEIVSDIKMSFKW